MSWVGRAVPLKEDARLVAGRGRFLDDLTPGRVLHAAMLRSPHAHARIVALDVSAAAALPAWRPCSPAPRRPRARSPSAR